MPNASAASLVDSGTASIPALKISTLNYPAKKEREIIAQPTFDIMGTSSQPSGE